jgi:hypothetical protein
VMSREGSWLIAYCSVFTILPKVFQQNCNMFSSIHMEDILVCAMSFKITCQPLELAMFCEIGRPSWKLRVVLNEMFRWINMDLVVQKLEPLLKIVVPLFWRPGACWLMPLEVSHVTKFFKNHFNI